MIDPGLPTFRYHPDPLETGSLKGSGGRCPYCERNRAYVYDGPIYGTAEREPPCPWCIADGSFSTRFDAQFSDDAPLSDLDPETIDEVTRRTPGFSGWQQEHWMTHCSDAAAFLGPVGYRELLSHPNVMESLRSEIGSADWLEALSRDGSPTAYLFRCRHCALELAYWDVD
jgi:uncharacterized protein CbrC (UPF0167 family)